MVKRIILTLAALVSPAAASAQSAPALPIERGVWVSTAERCADASNGFVYDGQQWGSIYYYLNPQVSRDPQAELHRVTKTTKLRDGYTDFRTTQDMGALAYERVRSTGAGRATYRMGAPARSGMDVDEQTLQLCGFSSLSARMQAAIRRFAPALAGAAAAAVPGAGAAASRPTAAQGWRVEGSSNNVATYAAARPIRSIALRCDTGGSAIMAMELPPMRGQSPIRVHFWNQFPTDFYYAKDQDFWIARMTSAMLGLMVHDQTMLVSVPGLQPERVSLAGSSNALRQALNACLYAPGPDMPAATGPLGLAPGHYVNEGALCADAEAYFYYDGQRYGHLYGGSPRPELQPVGTPRRSGKSWRFADGTIIEPLAPGRLHYDEYIDIDVSSNMRWCPADQIAASLRVR